MIVIKKNNPDIFAITIVLFWFVGNVTYIVFSYAGSQSLLNVVKATIMCLFYAYCFLDKNKIHWFIRAFSVLHIIGNILNTINTLRYDYGLAVWSFIFLITLYSILMLESFTNNKIVATIGLIALIANILLVITNHINLVLYYADNSFLDNPYLRFPYLLSCIVSFLLDLLVLYVYCRLFLKKYHIKKAEKITISVEKNFAITEETLESIKEKFNNGEINEEEYNSKKAEIMKSL